MDLVALQENTGQLRNPFGFDFVTTWNKKPIVLKGDNKWKTVIGPLRAHIAEMLYQKIRYQYHDEQVAKLKEKGLEKDARKYHVPAAVENKIWMMITGENLPTKKGRTPELEQQEQADLSELEHQLSSLDKQAKGDNSPVNVMALVDKANEEAITASRGVVKADGDTTHNGGVANIDGTAIPEKHIDTTPVDAEDLAQTSEAVATPVEPVSPIENAEFGELAELDDNGQQ